MTSELPEELGKGLVKSTERYLAEIKLFKEQNFLRLINTRQVALSTVREIVERKQYSLLDLFVTAFAIGATFFQEGVNLGEQEIGETLSDPLEHIPLNDTIELLPRSPEESIKQEYGFSQKTEIIFTRLLPEDGEAREEKVSIIREQEGIDNDHFEIIILERDIDGLVKSYKVAGTKGFHEDIPDVETNKTEYDIPMDERARFVRGFLEYLEKAPFGYPDHDSDNHDDNLD